jgi:crotonobetainyl-CoA:carnitine CoA-transferase CaiB-like acyl-CoA transferase
MNYLATGENPPRLGNQHPNIVPYQVFPTADGFIVLSIGNDPTFRRFCEAFGLAHLLDDDRFATNPARVAHRHELNALLAAELRAGTADQWWARLTPAGVPCGPINDIAAAFDLATRVGLDPVAQVPRPGGEPSPQVAAPFRLSATPPAYRLAPPVLGSTAIDDVLRDDGAG